MKKIFLTTLFAVLCVTSICKAEPLGKIITENGIKKIVLTPTLSKYIEENFRGYSIPIAPTKNDNSDPENPIIAGKLKNAMINGDFNGDKKPDIALILEAESESPLLVVIENEGSGKFYHYILEVVSQETQIYHESPGTIETANGKGYGKYDPSLPSKIQLKYDSINVSYGMSSATYYWDGKKFRQEWTSD